MTTTPRPVPRTQGENIADDVARWCEGTGCFVAGRGNHMELARRIDAVIKLAVKKERQRCFDIVATERSKLTGACPERRLLNDLAGKILYTKAPK
jgi:hypothetical protein